MTLKRLACFGIIALSLSWAGLALATGSPPHDDYRIGGNPGYAPTNCSNNGAACHPYNKNAFLQDSLAGSPSNDYTGFCLACHNAEGEAHDRSVGAPSTNAYDHMTTLIPGDYQGNSHSWNGLIKNAGTRVPTVDGMAGTTHMPGGKVRCQTCHDGIDKTAAENINWVDATTGDNINFTILGYSNTKQYLSHYIKVYRSFSPQTHGNTGTITESRKKKDYLVNYTAYTYNYQNATITFKQPQAPGIHIYADISQPYLRADNTADRLCYDCHIDRKATQVTHERTDAVPGGKDHHPVDISYGWNFGLHSTLRDDTEVGLYMEGGRVGCTTCHDMHNSVGMRGSLLREKEDPELCMDCHSTKKVAQHKGVKHPKFPGTTTVMPTTCTECHGAHNTRNILLVRDRVKAPSGMWKAVRFKIFSGVDSFGDGGTAGICKVCHTRTIYHGASSVRAHNEGKNCLKCHTHEEGFSPKGGAAPCYGCHAAGGRGWDIKSLMGLGTSMQGNGKASRHYVMFDNNSTYTSSSCLAMCHKTDHLFFEANLKSSTELSLCLSCHAGGSGLTTRGKPVDVAAQFSGTFHNFTTTLQDEFGKFKYQANCTKCHLPHGSDDYPMIRQSVNGRATGGNTNEVCFGCHNPSRPRGAANIEALWKADPSNRGHYDQAAQMACVRCHSPHGSRNGAMIQDSLGGPGLAPDSNSVCLACHSGQPGGSIYNVMSNQPGQYGPGYSAASVHDVGLHVAVGGYTFDLTCAGCHDPHNTRNARLLQDTIMFSGHSSIYIQTVRAEVRQGDGVTKYISGWNSYCIVCHTSMTQTGGQSPYRRHPNGVRLSDYASDYQTYSNTFSNFEVPLESGYVACISCHFTHGSPKPSLLRFQNATTPTNRQCLRCHAQGAYMQGGPGSHGGFIGNKGNCSDCHNMHSLANKRLLKDQTESVLCKACHGVNGVTKFNVWVEYTSLRNYTGLRGTGGTFGRYSELRGGTARSMHAINDEATPAPGGITTQHRCGSCHNPHGSKNYRVLRTTVNNVTGINVYARVDAEGRFISYSTGLVKFCSACHTDYKTAADENGNWIRHPVGVSLAGYTAIRNYYRNNTSYRPKVELESGETISCATCHFAHGSPADANLKFPGGRAVNACKTCHNRDQFNVGVSGAHAGYSGDEGTCGDCHSMHADRNAKLLKKDAETAICVDCHDNPGTSRNAHPSRLDVWKGSVADLPEAWLGTAGSFGNYSADPAHGGDIWKVGSMHPVNSEALIAPGDSATVVHCGTCHDGHGSPNYRLLKTHLNGKWGINVTASVDPATRRTTSYGSGMSSFCSACHKDYINCGTAAGYTRHPVDVALTAQEMLNYNHAQGPMYLPLEAGNKVTCTTCHFAHGSPLPKMLRMPQTAMCQACHAKGLDTANGYVQVTHTHGGFNGNNGNCSACHYVHRLVYGNHTTNQLNRKLLVEAEESLLCYGCHAEGGARHGNFPAAQVVWAGDNPPAPDAWDKTGGSFGAGYDPATGGSIYSKHQINNTSAPAPGGTTTEHRCGSCHNPHGSGNYRILRDTVNNVSNIRVYAKTDGQGRLLNYSSGIAGFCTACHADYGNIGTGVGGYRRHPLNLALTAQESANLSGASSEPRAQVEGGRVTCLSCHWAHGSPGRAMLRMQSYTGSDGAMCQQCHRKGFNTAGAQFRYTHGGFNGNKANCRVCHSQHRKNNKKLLINAREADLCNNCHSGVGKFNAFRAETSSGVSIDKPSRFNVFSSIGNSFGNYSVGGGDVVSWHAVDGTHPAPGGKTVELRCGKCHNPHGEDNFVMIRNTIENVTAIRVFGHVSSTGPFNTYSSGFGRFCSACHTRLTSCGTGNPWTRHPVDFKLKNKQFTNWSSYKPEVVNGQTLDRVPIEAGSQVTCITCHNSHGSKNHNLQRLGGNSACQQCHKR